jgi:hypothetical protein
MKQWFAGEAGRWLGLVNHELVKTCVERFSWSCLNRGFVGGNCILEKAETAETV